MLHSKRLIFIKTRKTAGTSIEIALSALAEPSDILTPLVESDERLRRELVSASAQNYYVPIRRYRPRDFARLLVRGRRAALSSHSSAARIRAALGHRVWSSYTKVAVERHPLDRLRSLYWWDTNGQASRPTFDEYVRSLPSDRISNYPLYSLDGSVAVDRLLRYEDLETELADLGELLNLELPPLPRAKAGVRPPNDRPIATIDPDTVRTIRAACGREIELMGYEL